MRILHTSDWHLGAEMEGRKRYDETAALLGHIINTVKKESVDTLLITGDVFDTHTPSNLATKQYYDFLVKLHEETDVQNVVIIAGNHDSPSYLEAPAGLLKLLNIHVIGNIQDEHPEREVIPLLDNQKVAAVACAVPYLISPGLPGKTQAEQDAAYEKYVIAHYRQIVAMAKEHFPGVPLIAMGHFFAVGGRGSDDSILRGNLHSVHVEVLPLEDIDYLALGHLHRAQTVNMHEKVRYAGSLQKMNFLECDSDKEFVLWDSTKPEKFISIPVTRAEVPQICRMTMLKGTVGELENKLRNLQDEQNAGEELPLWVAIQNTGAFCNELKRKLEQVLREDSGLDIVFCKNMEPNPVVAQMNRHSKRLEEMTPEKLFEDFLDNQKNEEEMPPDELEWYMLKLREAITACHEDDTNME